MVIRMLRIRFVLMSVLALLALTASATIVAPVAGAAPAHGSKAKAKAKAKGKKKKKKKKAKAPVKKVANVKVTGGSERLLFNSTTVAALEKAKVTVTPGGTASGTLAGGLVFQVSGGTLNPGTGFGSVSGTGGVIFASSFGIPGLFTSETNATFSEPVVKLAASAASLSFTSANFTPPTFEFGTLGLKGVKPTSHAGGVTISKIPVSLASGGVSFLGAFASGFTVGEVVGTLTIEAT